MKLPVLLLALLAPSLAVQREYIYVNQLKNWTEALTYCRENYDDLATIDNREDLARVVEMNGDSSFKWIGLYDDVKSWRWSIDSAPLYDGENINLGNWFVFNADKSNYFDHCAYISQGALADDLCKSSRPSVCYDGTSYIAVATPMNWSSAQDYCRQTYTDLASVRSQEEMNAIMSLIDQAEWWVGLSRDGWKWSDRSNSAVTLWDSSQPNSPNDNCGGVNLNGFYDRPCYSTGTFFCSVFPRRTIFKIVLQTAGSADLNDPLVQETVLKHMEDHLSEEGMRAFRFMWKKRASGNVFNRTAL